MSTCIHSKTTVETPTITDSKPKAFVRRLIQKVAPVRDARVRYDADKKLWALLDEKNLPIRHFAYGYIEGAHFSSTKIEKKYIVTGCGGSHERSDWETIGIATGTLREGVYHPEVRGLVNLAFRDGHFVDGNGADLTSASVLQLMPDRRALYRA